jgi:K+-transporting ATPase KdpF subunit
VILASIVENWVALGISALLAVYLVAVLVFPERF